MMVNTVVVAISIEYSLIVSRTLLVEDCKLTIGMKLV